MCRETRGGDTPPALSHMAIGTGGGCDKSVNKERGTERGTRNQPVTHREQSKSVHTDREV